MNARAAVKVRWQRGGVIGPWLPTAEAAAAASRLCDDVVECGDGTGFVTFVGFDGRVAHIRGRDVVTVECVPDLPARVIPAATVGAGVQIAQTFPAAGPAHTGTPVSYPATGIRSATGSGTAFLQQQATRRPSINGAGR